MAQTAKITSMTQRNSGFSIPSGFRFLLTVLFILGVGILFTKILRNGLWNARGLVEAVVIDIHIQSGNTAVRGASPLWETIQFEYSIDGQKFSPRQSFSYNTSFFIGQTVPVRYLPETPWVAKIQTGILDDGIFLPIGLLLTMSIFAIMAMQARHNRREKQKRKPH
jgi:hypothetical protein